MPVGEEAEEGNPAIIIMSPVMYLSHSGFLQLRPQPRSHGGR